MEVDYIETREQSGPGKVVFEGSVIRAQNVHYKVLTDATLCDFWVTDFWFCDDSIIVCVRNRANEGLEGER